MDKKPQEQRESATTSPQASRTALWTTICRAMAHMETDPLRRGPDDLAALFIPPVKRFLLKLAFIRRRIHKKLTPGVYAYLMARTRHYDALFAQALDARLPQIVILGAGYDTRALRFGDHLGSTRVFEVDQPATQAGKLEALRRACRVPPERLCFVPVDLRAELLHGALENAGYDAALDTLFLWEGVTMYLPRGAVEATLAVIRRYAGAKSTVAFDYFFKSVVEGRSHDYGAREQYEAVRSVGEPFKFGIEAGGIDAFLDQNGFQVLSHYDPDAFEEAYLCDAEGVRLAKLYRCAGNVHAEKRT